MRLGCPGLSGSSRWGHSMSDYNASSIVILEPTEISQRFSWARVAELAERYRKPAQWVARGLEACRRAGVADDYFIARYLQRAPIERHEGVDAAMRELLTESVGKRKV